MVSEETRLAELGRYVDRVLEQVPDPCNAEQLAAAVGLNPVSIRRACQQRELPGVKVGKSWRISHTAVRIWIENGTQEGLAS